MVNSLSTSFSSLFNLNWTSILTQMTLAAEQVAIGSWVFVQPYVESTLISYGTDLVDIATDLRNGNITQPEATLLMKAQANSMQAFFSTIQGIEILTAESIVNAALNVLRDAVNAAVGFTLI